MDVHICVSFFQCVEFCIYLYGNSVVYYYSRLTGSQHTFVSVTTINFKNLFCYRFTSTRYDKLEHLKATTSRTSLTYSHVHTECPTYHEAYRDLAAISETIHDAGDKICQTELSGKRQFSKYRFQFD